MTKRFSRDWFISQLKLNSVAIVSLFTAISDFTYNTWQGHQTVVNYAHYAGDKSRGNPIEGWKHATMVRDLSRLLDEEAAKQGQALFVEWEQDWEKLEADNQSEARISAQIAQTRQAVLSNMDALE